MKRIAVLIYLVMLSAACVHAPLIHIQNEVIVEAEYDKVWETIIDLVAEKQLPTEVIEKKCGIVDTNFAYLGSRFALAHRLKQITTLTQSSVNWERGRYRLTVLIRKKGENQTLVRINSHIEGLTGTSAAGQWYFLPSNGYTEAELFFELKSRLGIATPQDSLDLEYKIREREETKVKKKEKALDLIKHRVK